MSSFRQLVVCGVAFLAVLLVPDSGLAVSPEQYQSLVDLYVATGGDDWTVSDGWLEQDSPDDFDAPCVIPWDGVFCIEDAGQWRITALVLDGNNLDGPLPESIGVLSDVEILDLSGNSIDTIPDAVGNLSALNSLSLASNALTSLPSTLASIPGLLGIDVSENEIEALPEAIFKIASLKSLKAGSNLLSSLSGIEGGGLEVLDVSNNTLVVLPAEIKGLVELRTLDVSGNQLATMPELEGLSSLENLFFQGNRFRGPLEELIPEDVVHELIGRGVFLNFSWNALFVTPETKSLYEEAYPACCGGWQAVIPSQTIAPHALAVSEVTNDSAFFSWSPVDTEPARLGGYEIYLSSDGGVTYDLAMELDGKENAAAELLGLESGSSYSVRIESFTYAHADNGSRLSSLGSGEGGNIAVFATLDSSGGEGDSDSGGEGKDPIGCGCVLEVVSTDLRAMSLCLVCLCALRRRRSRGESLQEY